MLLSHLSLLAMQSFDQLHLHLGITIRQIPLPCMPDQDVLSACQSSHVPDPPSAARVLEIVHSPTFALLLQMKAFQAPAEQGLSIF